jgi:hypothetical protein
MIHTPKGNNSTKFGKGRTWKRHMRIEKIARLTVAGTFTNAQIANAMGIHVQTIIEIRRTPEFHSKMIELSTGVISEHDKDLREIEENQIAELSSMLPSALLVLRNSLLSTNPTIALRAATEIMDRDGKLAKVSKVNVHHDESPNLDNVNTISSNIMALLSQGANSANSVSILESFTVSAARAGEQIRVMSEDIDEKALKNIDMSNSKPN